MKDKQTPLMRQYNQIKSKHPNAVLLFRLGDFFETFDEDAKITAKVCGLTLTKRNNGAAGECPLAGFPHHQLDSYLPKLVKAGYRVAVCDQLEDPKASRGIVKRGITEVVTPGAALYEKLLEAKKNNYLSAIAFRKEKQRVIAGLAFADISTGEFFCGEAPVEELPEIFASIAPAEILINKSKKEKANEAFERLDYEPVITKLEPWILDEEFGREALLGHFKTKNLKGFGVENLSAAVAACGAILYYIKETQKGNLSHIKTLSLYERSEYMTLDYATRRNLEIGLSLQDTKDGSLISILDKTKTAMGGRLFKRWVSQPLINLKKIKTRREAVEFFFENREKRTELRETLSEIGDLERIISKISSGRALPRDMINLKTSLAKIPEIKEQIHNTDLASITALESKLSAMDPLIKTIDSALLEDPSSQLGLGNVFKPGFSEELDSYIDAKFSGKSWIKNYQNEERKKSGIPSLKTGFNNVFGYYIEITKIHKNKVPERYERKQTLTNSERYTTPELKEIEEKIISAEEKIEEIERELFEKLREKIAEEAKAIQENAKLIAIIDCLQNLAQAADEYDYEKPEVDDSVILDIEEGRHPVVERTLDLGKTYVGNPTKINPDEEQIQIITGPNMSGKSCYLRQIGLIVLLAQIGGFVPAKKSKIGIVDRIFTRVGAQDNISGGESTFLVEMQEAANIMNNCTRKSLVLLDEVGRGTATFDGISIAWAITEHLHNNVGAKTIFATHYHELNDLADRYERIVNYKIEVIEAGDSIIFTHKVLPGASDHSFGINVAQMAGLPKTITDRAEIIMRSLESDSSEIKPKEPNVKAIKSKKQKAVNQQMSIFEFRDDPLREQLLKLDLNNMTPMEGLKILGEMKKKAKKRK